MTASSTSRPRLLWVDLVRAAAGFGVVFTHVTMIIVNYWDKKPLVRGDEIDQIWWTTSVFYAFLARSALGLFFMISGYLLLPSLTETFTFLKKRVWKLLIPLVFWGTFYILWHGNLPDSLLKTTKSILIALATGKVEFHLWFLYVFIGLYLFIPILRIFVRNAKDSELWYYVAIWFILGPVFGWFLSLTGYQLALTQFLYFGGFIGFLLLGYLLGKRDLGRKWIIAAWILLPLWAGAETFGLYYQTRVTKYMNDQWFDTLTIFVTPYVVLCFIALKGLGQRIQQSLSANSKLPAILETMSRASLGIILVHVFVLEVMYTGIGGVHLAPYDFHPILSVPVVSIVGYLICFAIVFVMQKIPLLRDTVPS
jgi:surface polysaccharide O-acyltransferase-like enzyme